MMSIQRNYYEVLGIPPGASADQIKKKYRELARKFHPDVVQDKVLGQRLFTQINQAYSVLGDPERRVKYNDSLQNPAAMDTSVQQSAAQQAAAQQAAARNAAAQNAAPKASPAPQAGAAAAAPSKSPQAFAEMLSRAENSIMAGKPVEARAFCVRILEADPRHIRALDILGDALVQMGKPEEAAEQYRKALQAAPSSLIQAKLNRVSSAGTAPRPASAAAPISGGNGMPPRNGNGSGNGAPPKNGSGNGTGKTIPPSAGSRPAEAEKPGGLFGRILGRK